MFPIPVNTGAITSTSPNMVLNFASTTAQFIDPRVTFTRSQTSASNPVGTYYNSAGVLSYAGYNLLTYSQDFSNAAWAKAVCTVAANATTAPNGASNAGSLTANGSISYIYQDYGSNLAAGTYAFSAYVKAGTNNFAALNVQGTSSYWATAVFDVATGVVGQATVAVGAGLTIVSTSIQSVGSGWFRCVMIVTIPASRIRFASVMFAPLATGNTLTTTFGEISGNTAGKTVYAWGAQLEVSSTANTYAATTSAATGAPRFDYDPVALTPKGLLIEESRANLFTYSSAFDSSDWAKSALTISADSTASPDGTSTADTFTDTASNTYHIVYRTFSGTATTSYTISAYVKAGTGQYVYISSNAGGALFAAAVFNLSTGTVANTSVFGSGWSITSSAITSVGNSWYRCSLTFVSGSTGTLTAAIGNSNTATAPASGSSGLITYLGAGAYNYFWGAQLEVGAFATSYIPTVASSVTRGADNASMTGTNFSSWYNQTQGTFVIQNDFLSTSGVSMVGFSADNGVANGVLTYKTSASANYYVFLGANNALILASFLANTPTKTAIQYSAVSRAVCTGGNIASVTNGLSGYTATQLLLGKSWGGNQMSGHVQKLSYYPTPLSDSQIKGLTA